MTHIKFRGNPPCSFSLPSLLATLHPRVVLPPSCHPARNSQGPVFVLIFFFFLSFFFFLASSPTASSPHSSVLLDSATYAQNDRGGSTATRCKALSCYVKLDFRDLRASVTEEEARPRGVKHCTVSPSCHPARESQDPVLFLCSLWLRQAQPAFPCLPSSLPSCRPPFLSSYAFVPSCPPPRHPARESQDPVLFLCSLWLRQAQPAFPCLPSSLPSCRPPFLSSYAFVPSCPPPRHPARESQDPVLFLCSLWLRQAQPAFPCLPSSLPPCRPPFLSSYAFVPSCLPSVILRVSRRIQFFLE